MILDTSFVIDVLRKNDKALKKLEELEASDEVLSITAITIFELWHGLIRIRFQKEKENRLLETMRGLITLNLDFESAKEGGKMYGELKGKGIAIDAEDCMIAGIAKIER